MIDQQAEGCTRQANTGDEGQVVAELTDTVRRYQPSR
jgi:hypothetical protein